MRLYEYVCTCCVSVCYVQYMCVCVSDEFIWTHLLRLLVNMFELEQEEEC